MAREKKNLKVKGLERDCCNLSWRPLTDNSRSELSSNKHLRVSFGTLESTEQQELASGGGTAPAATTTTRTYRRACAIRQAQ